MKTRAAFLFSLLLTLPAAAPADNLPPGFQDNLAFGGQSFDNAAAIRFAPDGRVFVAERSGVIKTFDDLNDTTATVFADLSGNVYNAWDRGLLGLAIDPDFPAEPYVYVFYTYDATIGGSPPLWGDTCPDPPGFTNTGCLVSSRLSRLTASGDTMTGPEDVLMEGWCQQFPSHSVGDLAFGADGALYLTHGDGAHFNFPDYGQVGNPCGDPVNEGGAMRCQDIATGGDPLDYHGCMLRVDPATGAALPDNPLFGGNAEDDRVVAYGLRNPFRFTIRPGTDELWIGDVGWGGFEEINRITDPIDVDVENFGWPCYEGPVVQSGYDALDLPICETLYQPGGAVSPYYSYVNTGNAITGLAFYPGGSYPDEYDGALFFGDFGAAWIRVMLPGPGGDPDPANIQTFSTNAAPVDMTIGPDGDLYYVSYSYQGPSFVRRIQYFPLNQPPIVDVTANPTSGAAPLNVNFDASGSFDPDPNDTISFEWDLDADGQFDDGTNATEQFTYLTAGTVSARVRVTDNHGDSTIGNVVISVDNRPPVPTIDTPLAGTTWRVGDQLSFSGSALDPDSGPIVASELSWEIILHHCEATEHEHDPNDPNHPHDPNESGLNCHQHALETFDGVASGSFTAVDHEYPSFLEIKLTATDEGAPGWWDTDWSHRQRMAFEDIGLGAAVQAAPVLVRLNPSRTDYGLLNADGSDLRFISANGQPLDYEIASWDPAGESLIWVKVDEFGGNPGSDHFWMYLGNPGASDAQVPGSVWTSNYAGVWHLDESAGGTTSVLTNTGFEDAGGSLDSWFTYGSTDVSTSARTGAAALKMQGQFSGGFSFSLVFQDAPAGPGETWELSAFQGTFSGDSIVGTSNFAELKIEFFDGAFNMLQVDNIITMDGSSTPDVWVPDSMQATSPAGTVWARAVLTFVQLAEEPGSVLYDDVVFGVAGSGGGVSFADASGNGNSGSNQGSLGSGGLIGGARGFNDGRLIQIPSSASLEITGGLTLQAWVRPANPDLEFPRRILSKKTGWDAGSGYELEYDALANNFTVLGSGPDFGRATPIDLDSGWHMMTATISGNTALLYVDGVAVTTDPSVTALAAGSEALLIGEHGGGGVNFHGDIDEVRISDVVRSPDWIAAQYHAMSDQLLLYGAVAPRNPLTGTVSLELQPETSMLTLESLPPGLDLVVYSDAQATPFWQEAIVFANTTLSAPSPQVLDGDRYEFVSWSNGQPQSHALVVQPQDETYVATFVEGCSAGCSVGPDDVDFDGDCDVDLSDLGQLLTAFGTQSATHADGDANGDGRVDLTDLSMVLSRFGVSCP